MPPYLQLGSIPPKRHTKHAADPGHLNEGLYYEEVISTQGFNRAYSIDGGHTLLGPGSGTSHMIA